MKLLPFGLCPVVLLLSGWSPVLAQGKLWVVDAAGGAGADFLELQAAVDAAADGDSILVRQGTAYPDFVIDAKALTVFVETGSEAWMNGAVIRNTAAHHVVTLRGIEPRELRVEDCAGPVLLEDIGDPLDGPFVSLKPCHGFGSGHTDAVGIVNSAAVVMSRCNINAGFWSADSSLALPAIEIVGSNVHMYEVGATGGHESWPAGLDGGNGVEVTGSSFLFASGCYFVGGCGGDDSSPGCPTPGKGGIGLVVSASTVHVLEAGLWAGAGGYSDFCGFSGPGGAKSSGGYSLVAGYAREYAISASVSGGVAAEIQYAGEPGDLALSLVSLDASPLSLLELAGTLVVAIPPILIVHGPVSATGELVVLVPTPALPPGLEALPVYVQGAAVSAVGAAVLAAPSVLTIL